MDNIERIYCKSRNPILPSNYLISDVEGHQMQDGRLYLYGDVGNPEIDDTYESYVLKVVSTSDMKKWVIHNSCLCSEQIPWVQEAGDSKWIFSEAGEVDTPMLRKLNAGYRETNAKGKKGRMASSFIYAPDAAEYEGKYYLYFPCSDSSEGVAVSEEPQGPFHDVRRMNCKGIDPAVFVDDDGQAYYYWGQFRGCGAKLKRNMTEIDRSTMTIDLVTEEEHHFHEGMSIRKRGNYYYCIYADITSTDPTSLGYAMSKSPLGPYEYKGVIIDNKECDPDTWNNHGSIVEFKGSWYVFYHRTVRGNKFFRRVCAEPIEFREDGTIIPVIMTSQGLGEPFRPGEDIEMTYACGLLGTCYLEPEDPINGEHDVLKNISCGDTAIFRYVDFSSGVSSVKVSGNSTGTIRLYLGEERNLLLAELTIHGGEDAFSLIEAENKTGTLLVEVLDCDSKFQIKKIRFE